MRNISHHIIRAINREIDIGKRTVTKCFQTSPIMKAAEMMSMEEQEMLIQPFLALEKPTMNAMALIWFNMYETLLKI